MCSKSTSLAESVYFVFRNFGWLMLAGFRALVEQQPLQEEYDTFG